MLREPERRTMSVGLIAVVVVVASTVLMSAVTLAIGILRRDSPREPDVAADTDAKSRERRSRSHLHY
jgi:hypothetical protein